MERDARDTSAGPSVTAPNLAVRHLRRNLSTTMVTSLALLVITLASGVVTARVLQPSGRGELAAILTWEQIVGWLVSLGLNEAITYLVARHPQHRARTLSTLGLLSPVLGLIGLALGELILPLAFHAQSAHVLHLGRVYFVVVVVDVVGGVFLGALAGNHDFGFVNIMRLAQPIVMAVGVIVLWRLDALSVGSALAVSAVASGVTLVLTSVRLKRLNGFGAPDRQVLREGVSYGLRSQGGLIGSLVNGRLDLLIMPAFLAARSIGLYAIATSVSSVVVTIVGNLSRVIFAAASTLTAERRRLLVERSLRVLLLCALLLAVPLLVAAPWALKLVYGRSFIGATLPLRLLVPGVVFMALGGVAESGLQAANRPGRASTAQLVGVVVTLVGLAATLGPLGIDGAAITSTLSYLTTFVVAAWFLHRVDGVRVVGAVSPRELWREIGELRATSRQGRHSAKRAS